MRSLIVSLPLLLALCLPAMAFDCGQVVFGTPMSELDDGNFVPYMEKGGVTYYNYTGPCRMALHEYTNPAIAFAAVDGRIYARIVRTFDGDIKNSLAKVEEKAGPPVKTYKDGDWDVYAWNFPDDVEAKLKFNRQTGELRSAVYYKPLRDKLKTPGADPTEIPVR